MVVAQDSAIRVSSFFHGFPRSTLRPRCQANPQLFPHGIDPSRTAWSQRSAHDLKLAEPAKMSRKNELTPFIQEGWSWGPVEGSADLLFHAWPCGIFQQGAHRAFAGENKVLAKCVPEKSGGDWLCWRRSRQTCPKNGTGGHSITPSPSLTTGSQRQRPEAARRNPVR